MIQVHVSHAVCSWGPAYYISGVTMEFKVLGMDVLYMGYLVVIIKRLSH